MCKKFKFKSYCFSAKHNFGERTKISEEVLYVDSGITRIKTLNAVQSQIITPKPRSRGLHVHQNITKLIDKKGPIRKLFVGT